MIRLGIYLLGCILAYILQKKDWTDDGYPWTKGNRVEALGGSILLSWLMVIIFLLKNASKNNKPAKW